MSDTSRSRADTEFSRRAILRGAAGGGAAALAVAATGLSQTAAAPNLQSGSGGKLTTAWGRYPLTFNPLDPVGGIERTVWQLTTSRLINKDVTGKIIPDFAESWEISDDGLTYTFHLAQNATWSDGTPATARDVAATYTFATDIKTGGKGFTPAATMAVIEGVADFLAGTAKTVSGIQVVDDHTITFKLSRPDATFFNIIAGYYGPYLVPAHIVGEVPAADFDQHEYNTNPVNRVGMGPYILTEAIKDQDLIFSRNDTFFKGAPVIDSYIYRVMQPDVALTALLSGEIDVANIPASEYPTVSQDTRINSITYDVNLWNGLMFNMTVKDLQDPRIHQAVVYSLDRETYAKKILNDLGVPWDSIYCQEQWLSPNIVNYEYNPEKAKSLLTEAGWDSNRVVEWKYYNPFFATLAPVLQQGLADIGMKINPVELETATWVDQYQAGQFEFSVVGGGGITDDPSELVNYFQCDVWSRYCNQDLLDLFAKGGSEVDPTQRKATYDQIQEIVNKDLPWFPLFKIIAAVGFSKAVNAVAYSSYDYLFYEKWSRTE